MMSDVSDNICSKLNTKQKNKTEAQFIQCWKAVSHLVAWLCMLFTAGIIRALHHHLIKSNYGSVVGAKDDTAEENEFFQELKDFSGHCLLQEINTSLDDYKMTTQTLHNAITFVQ